VPVEEWKDARQRLGIWGERMALAYFMGRGWTVEGHRFRYGRHDIDLIVRQGHVVAFVEVKTRRTSGFGSGLQAVGGRKQRILGMVANLWRLRYGRSGDTYRFDVIGVHGSSGRYVIDHVEDAWRL
jgi:putative endonuclease